MSSTRRPRCPACAAHIMPAAPAPMTTTFQVALNAAASGAMEPFGGGNSRNSLANLTKSVSAQNHSIDQDFEFTERVPSGPAYACATQPDQRSYSLPNLT